MKKFLKWFVFFSLIIISFIIAITILLYSPTNEPIGDEITINKIIYNSLHDISIVNGGQSLIDYKDIEVLINNKISNIKSNDSSIILENLKIDGNDNGILTLVGYTKIQLINKLYFPTSFTIKFNIQTVDNELMLQLTKAKIGKISLPPKNIFNLINNKINIYDKLASNYSIQTDTNDIIFKVNLANLFSNYRNIGQIDNLKITDNGISLNLIPNNIISNIITGNLKPAISLINKDIDTIENTLSNQSQKDVLYKVKDVVAKIEKDEIYSITASELTDVINDIDNLEDSSKQDFIEIFSKNINNNSKEQLIKSFSNVLSSENLQKLENAINNR